MIRKFRHTSKSVENLVNNPAHQFAQSYALRIYNASAIYTFIPKNACTTLRTSLAIANGCIDTPNDFNWIHRNNFTFSADLAAMASAQYTFTILRCPYARLASLYLDKIISNSFIVTKLQELVKDKPALKTLSFHNFVTCINDNNILNENNHWCPQVDFLVYQQYDDYFCVEDFETAAATLKEKIGFKIIDARELSKHGSSHLEKIKGQSLSLACPHELLELKEQGLSPDYRSLYSDQLVDIVQELYKEDLALYSNNFGTSKLLYS